MDERDRRSEDRGRLPDPMRTDPGPAPRIPAARPELQARPDERRVEEAPGPLALVVEGTESFRETLEDIFVRRGFRVLSAVSTLQARRLVRQRSEEAGEELPGIIVVNAALPGIGWQKLAELLQEEQGYDPRRVIGYSVQGWFPEEELLARVEQCVHELGAGTPSRAVP